MNSKEFEVLNKKMNLMYEEIMALVEDFKNETLKRDKIKIEAELENAQSKLNGLHRTGEYVFENILERKKQFKDIDYKFMKE